MPQLSKFSPCVPSAYNHNDKYASIENCRAEVAEAEAMMRRAGIRWLSTTTKSIEEIATTILQEIRPERLVY